MMRKKMFAVLLCTLLMGALSGCGSQSEPVQQSAENKTAASETQAAESESETESAAAAESATEAQSETETESQTAETSASETTETAASGETAADGSTTATTAGKAGSETTTVTQTEAVQQEENQTQQQKKNNPPDEPAEVNIETEAPAQVDAPDPDAPAETSAETEPQTKELSMTVNYQGHSLTIGESAADFVAAVPELRSESAPSCYGNGENINYYYENEQVVLYVWNENGNYLAYGLDIYTPGIVSVDGLDIGSAVTFDGEKEYDMGNDCSILVNADGGVVNMISYNKDLPEI